MSKHLSAAPDEKGMTPTMKHRIKMKEITTSTNNLGSKKVLHMTVGELFRSLG